jgi:phosphopantetheine--protein transferase-like protein
MSSERHQDQRISNEFEVGIDAESTARFESGLDDVARSALFARAEHEYCASFPDAARRFAGTWCAKEAAVKALSRWVRLDPRRVVVTWANDGRPSIGVSGWDADEAGVSTSVCVSSYGPLAVAWVVAWGPPVSEGDAVRDGRPS